MWQNLTLGDIFPGLSSSVSELNEKVSDFLQKTQSVQAQINEKVSALQTMAQEAANFLEDLAADGFYVCVLEPGQGWSARLVSAEGAPPDDGICAGICIIVCAPDINEVSLKFQKLTNILTKPIKVP